MGRKAPKRNNARRIEDTYDSLTYPKRWSRKTFAQFNCSLRTVVTFVVEPSNQLNQGSTGRTVGAVSNRTQRISCGRMIFTGHVATSNVPWMVDMRFRFSPRTFLQKLTIASCAIALFTTPLLCADKPSFTV